MERRSDRPVIRGDFIKRNYKMIGCRSASRQDKGFMLPLLMRKDAFTDFVGGVRWLLLL